MRTLKTFRDAMLDAMGKTEEEFQNDCKLFDKNITRLYEYISPYNRIVTPYKESMLVALSYVDNKTGEEIVGLDPISEKDLGWNVRVVETYRFASQSDCLKMVEELSGLKEGVVVYNTQTKMRVKIKNATYLAAHRLRSGGLTLNSICELVVMNEQDEYLATFPEDSHKFDDAIVALGDLLHALHFDYAANKHIETQKEFALAVKDLPLSGCMFQARKKGTSVVHEFNQLPVGKRADYLKERLV